MEHDLNCTACMIGKAQLQPYPGSKEHAKQPLERGYIDIMTLSATSIEGYYYALIITDYASMYRWAYGLKTKDEANAIVRNQIADIADIRDRHKLEVIIRDNASELKSKDLTDHLESLGFKNYYSAAYEQWQNGLAESSITSLNLLVCLQMVESVMTGIYVLVPSFDNSIGCEECNITHQDNAAHASLRSTQESFQVSGIWMQCIHDSP